MTASRLSPAAERRALALVDDLVESLDDPATIAAALDAEEPPVRTRVERLLLAARQTGGMPTETDAASELPVPDRVGVFALVGEIARGGMGTVWRGERDDGLFEQVVAVKLLRTSAEALGPRFDAERRILARLDHPGIARLIDGGVTDAGVPYLVMEYVSGRHIDEAAAARPLAARIALFLETVRTVQFAHARLVVHADLKPSNILVDADGRVRLLDFGVARLLGEEGEGAGHPMTPAFASPARRRGDPPSIADDLFALGRILQGLIVGADDRDLDAIAAKAAAEDETRRYTGTGDLIADLERWRERLPVRARPSSWRYRAGRFVMRHRLGVAVTAASIVLLAATSIAAVVAARAAERERAVAERRFNDVRALSRFMLAELYDELGNAPGTVRARVWIAARARHYLDRLAATPGAPRALRLETAQGYERLARVQGVSGVASLGRPSEALGSLAAADAIVAGLLSRDPRDAAAQELSGQIALDRWTLAGENAASASINGAARAAFARALAIQPDRPGARLGLLLTEKNRAFELIWTEDRPAAAIPVLRAALGRLDRLRLSSDRRDEAQQLRVNLLNRLGDALYYAGDVPGSLVAFQQAQRVVEAELARRETLAWLERRGESHYYVSGSLEGTDLPRALAEARAGAVTMTRVLSYGPDANAEKWLAILYNQEAGLLGDLGRRAAAVAPALRSLAIRERRAAREPDDPRRARDLAVGLGSAADVMAKAGRGSEGCTLARRAVATWEGIARRGRMGRRDSDKAYPKARASAARLCTASVLQA